MNLFPIYVAVFFGGAAGSVARMWLSLFLAQRYGEIFPIGTLVVNVLGSLVIGLLAGLTNPDTGILVSPVVRQGLMVGVLGGFTTFSSFSLQTIELLQNNEFLYAGLNIVLSVVLCLVACWLGFVLSNLILHR